MFDIWLSNEYILPNHDSVDGTQNKYYYQGYFYKIDSGGKEGYVESLVSTLLSFSNLKKEEYVSYEMGRINDHDGCRSKNFLRKDEQFISLQFFHKTITGIRLSDKINNFSEVSERIDYAIQFFMQYANIDLTDYFAKIFMLNAIVLNEDCHFNNMGLIKTTSGYKTAPIFDNGRSLMTCSYSYNRNFSIQENIKRTVAKPFCGSFDKMAFYFPNKLLIDHAKAETYFSNLPSSREIDILLCNLNNYKITDIFKEVEAPDYDDR